MPDIPDIQVQLSDHGGQRVPIVLVLDTSGSMAPRMEGLNRALERFVASVKGNPSVSANGVFKMITFGNGGVQETDWMQGDYLTMPTLEAKGMTPMAEAMRLAASAIESLKREFVSQGLSYTRPWIFLMSDGGPTDEPQDLQDTAALCKAGCNARKFYVWPIGIPPEADIEVLKLFCRDDVKVYAAGQNNDFSSIFEWLYSSIGISSTSAAGQTVQHEPPKLTYVET